MELQQYETKIKLEFSTNRQQKQVDREFFCFHLLTVEANEEKKTEFFSF